VVSGSDANGVKKFNDSEGRSEGQRSRSNLFETFVDLFENSLLVEHFAAKPVLVVVADLLAQIAMQLPVRHVLLHLLELHSHTATATACLLASQAEATAFAGA